MGQRGLYRGLTIIRMQGCRSSRPKPRPERKRRGGTHGMDERMSVL